ncbi:MAG: DUF1107 family protein [Succinivibrio sp.]
MRVFKSYAPKQIAKYVVAFFKGQFSIEGQGVFEFDAGRVVVTVKMDEQSLKICKEINAQASAMSLRVQVQQYK